MKKGLLRVILVVSDPVDTIFRPFPDGFKATPKYFRLKVNHMDRISRVFK